MGDNNNKDGNMSNIVLDNHQLKENLTNNNNRNQ